MSNSALSSLPRNTDRRVGPGAQWLTEWLATFALVVTILAGLRFAQASVPWLTPSTSFENPALAIATLIDEHFSGSYRAQRAVRIMSSALPRT